MTLSILQQEINVAFDLLRYNDYEPELCSVAVPYYETPVMCGAPDFMYEDLTDEKVMIPRSLMGMRPVFVVPVKGDSMKDAGIMPGDLAHVELREDVADGDIVLACIDNDQCTIKTYFCDDNGQKWLLPRNKDYKPIRLSEDMNFRIIGKVIAVKRDTFRTAYRDCQRILKESQQENQPDVRISPEKAAAAIRKIAGEIAVGRMWYAAYRVFVDKKIIKDGDYDRFVSMVEEAVPGHKNPPKTVELSRMCIDSFRKPLAMWESDDAPVTGKRFKDYLRVGRLTQEALMD